MYGYVAIAFLAAVLSCGSSARGPPVRVTIDCGADEGEYFRRSSYRTKPLNFHPQFDVDSFCKFIHGAIPKGVKDGRFVLRELDPDQTGYGNSLVPISAPPPEGFIPKFSSPKFKNPRLKVPRINIPKLKPQYDKPYTSKGSKAPRVSTKSLLPFRSSLDEDSSVEKMEKFKKGVQKMLHVVKVLGQIDQYLSERTRIVIDKLARTFSD